MPWWACIPVAAVVFPVVMIGGIRPMGWLMGKLADRMGPGGSPRP